jgi:UDP-N-acetylglucosamine (GlcNAc):hydroxyproline polypeptide GlcNAc-transferase
VTREPEKDLVFTSIAAYREPQLNATVKDCIGKARDQGSLRFGICRHHAVAQGS